MTVHNVVLPQGTSFIFRREEDGPIILCVEAVYLDMLLVSAQRSTRVSKADEDDRLWWLPTFTAMVNTKYKTDLSESEGWVIARATAMVGDQLKKTFALVQKSLRSMESTPSNSPPSSETGSTFPSPEFKPTERSETEFANNL